MQIHLADVESALTLFTEGIAGRYLHIRGTEEFKLNPRLNLDMGAMGQSHDTLFLPEELATATPAGYRVLVMDQLGLRECGTLKFRMAKALEQIPDLANRYQPRKDLSPRTGDYRILFDSFDQPNIAERLFLLLDQARIQAYMVSTYPGLKRHLISHHEYLLAYEPCEMDLLGQGMEWLRGAVFSQELNSGPGWQALYLALQEQSGADLSVYDSVASLCKIYDQVVAEYEVPDSTPYQQKDESLVDWLNREQRIEDWEEDLDEINEDMATQAAANEIPTGQETEAVQGEGGDGSQREAGLDIETKELKDERDALKRRVDMERSSIQHALGNDRSAARSYRYDEWDHLNRRYLRAWCRVFEEELISESAEDIDHLKRVIRDYQPIVQRQLEQIRPTGLERVRRVQDGDELDLTAIIEARQDLRAGHSPDERYYSRKERVQRDVCAVFLVDQSASTDDPIHPPEPTDWSSYDEEAEVDLRAGWYSALEPEEFEAPEQTPRKIIDLERDAMVVMAASLDALGDSYGIYGFSGYSKDNVEIFVAKEPEDKFSQKTLQSIAAMQPRGSTRMGPAIRHGSHKLMASGHAMKVLIVISDGFPQDCDYGPERGNHDYGVEDTAKSLLEAQQKGIETFCITVDKSGHDYLKRMCPDERYMVIEDMEDLPDQLTKVYATLTGR